ncbi:MAG: DUF1538 family protein [Thiohalomonadaceae bacterium]
MILDLLQAMRESTLTIVPLAVVLLGFAWLLGTALPAFSELLLGAVVLVVGLALVVKGLELTLFPLAEGIAYDFVSKGSLYWLLLFVFTLGFGATIAEPALAAVAVQVAQTALAEGQILAGEVSSFSWGLRLATALGIALGGMLGIIRILRGWPLPLLLLLLLLPLSALVMLAPPLFSKLAFDMGISAMSTLAVPVIVALGIGLAGSLAQRSPLVDGFGMVSLALLLPPLCVLLWGCFW